MKFKFVALQIFILCLINVALVTTLNLQTFEGAINTESIRDTEGTDILKFLNLNSFNVNENDTDIMEAEILKQKSKK